MPDIPRPKGGYRGPRDHRGLGSARAEVLDLILSGVSSPSDLADLRGTSREAIYQHLDELIAAGWIHWIPQPRVGEPATYLPTDKAKEAARADHAARAAG